MRSGELAAYAGVTPRTVRHYRSIGLLPEPARDKNGYCNYQMEDLLRLLRIKNLVALGFSLEKAAQVLAEEECSDVDTTQTHLDALDRHLVAEIERLNKQRETIDLLKKARVSADTPAELVNVVALLLGQDMPLDLITQERELLLLLEHSVDDVDFKFLSDFYNALADHDLLDRYRDLGVRAYELGEDASESERDALAREGAEMMLTLIEDLGLSVDPPEERETNAVLKMYEDESLSPGQRVIFERALKMIDNTVAHENNNSSQ